MVTSVGQYTSVFIDYIMAKVVLSGISARRILAIQDPREGTTREGWCKGQYNFSHNIVVYYVHTWWQMMLQFSGLFIVHIDHVDVSTGVSCTDTQSKASLKCTL